jgi:hypothetical protein
MVVLEQNKINQTYFKLYQKHNIYASYKYIMLIKDRSQGIEHKFFLNDLSMQPEFYNIFNITLSSTTNYSSQTLFLGNYGYYNANIYITTDVNNVDTTNLWMVENFLIYVKKKSDEDVINDLEVLTNNVNKVIKTLKIN